jgi:hypothetical protein
MEMTYSAIHIVDLGLSYGAYHRVDGLTALVGRLSEGARLPILTRQMPLRDFRNVETMKQ